MAYARLLATNISTSEKVADLSTVDLKLFYTWSIAHTDDLMLLPSSPRELKATVMPYENYTTDQISTWIEELIECELYKRITYKNKDYLYLPDPTRIQNLRKNRKLKTIFPTENKWDTKKDEENRKMWAHYEALINDLIDNGSQVSTKWRPSGDHRLTEGKGREVKRREVNLNNGGEVFATPEASDIKEVLAVRVDSILAVKPNSGISYAWQDKAFRYAKHLGISLSDTSHKSRWLKFFRDNKSAKVDETISYLSDYQPYSKVTGDEARMTYFFQVYYNRA
jgi:hypothetical protein